MGSHDEDDDDIYSNLPGFKYHETLDKLQAANKSLQGRVTELEEEVEKLTKENAEYRDQCNKLSTNISSVIKTAQTEIKRKDSRISELNKEIISLNTRAYRFRRKRSFESSNENNNGIEKGKTNDNRKSPIKKKRSSIEPSFNVELNNYYCSPINKEEEPDKSHEKELIKPALVPNIQCHTVYSQRMFKKIYNTEPVKPVITDIATANEIVADTSTHSPNGAPNEANLMQFSELNNKPGKSNLVSSNNNITKPATSAELLARKQVPNNQSKTEQSNILKLFNKIDSEQSLPEKKLEESSIETKQKNISDSHSEIINPSHIPNNLKELSTDIPVNELKSIMSNVMTLNKMKDCQDKKLTGDLIFNPKGKKPQDSLISDTINNNEKLLKPLLGKCDKNSDKIIDKFGSKFLRAGKSTFSPISSQWNDVLQRKENEKQMKLMQKESSPPPEKSNENADLMEALFGSPLKWAENSEEAKEVPKLNPPLTAYEDSCSAQIENSKFEKINVREAYIKTTVQKNEKGLTASLRRPGITQTPFEQIKSDGKITNFSSLIRIETGEKSYNMTSLSVKIDQTSTSDKHTRTSVTSPKYNDSILGQFDDTTQLISALARDHSKISPIHTPIKESKTELVSSPENITKVKHENFNRNSVKTPPLAKVSPEFRKTEKKAILLDEPINILCPRKTPRTVRTKKPPSPKKDSNTSEGLNINNNETSLNDRKVSKDIHDTSLPKVQNSISASVHCAKVLPHTDELPEKVCSSKDSENCKKYIREDGKLKTKILEERKSIDRARNVRPKDHSDFTTKSPVVQTEPDLEKTAKKMFSHGSSEKKENLPFKFKREERKYTFKRPNISYYSSHRRQNCHFRHSSVERKLLKDRRYSSCIRNTPVRSVKRRTDHEPHYGKSRRPLNSEVRADKYDSNRGQTIGEGSNTDRGHKKTSKFPTISDKSRPRTPTIQTGSENCRSKSHSRTPTIQSESDNCRPKSHSRTPTIQSVSDNCRPKSHSRTPTIQSVSDNCRPKSHSRTPTIQSESDNCRPKSHPRTPTVQSDTENCRPRSSPLTPDASQVTKTTYIKRSSKKIEWSATTTDVVSTKPVETASQGTETKMKWFLQPIDFNVSSPLYTSKKSNIDNKTDSESANLADYCENNTALKLNTDTIAGNCSTPEKNLKSPIVIIPRKRPAKFGVSQMSVNHCLKVIEP